MIFLYLHKAYDALDSSRCLEILEGYSVGPKSRRLLTNYWLRLTMVARAGGYYRTAFGGERGVTQGDPLSPTIFNVLVDAVVHHWVHGIMEDAEHGGGRDGTAVIRPHSFTPTTTWSSRRTPPGSRVYLLPW